MSNTLWEELIKRMGGGLGADSVWPSMAPRASPQSTMRTDRNPGRGTSLVCCSVLPGRHIGYREEGRSRGWGQSVEGEGSVWKEVYIGKIFSEPLLKKQKTQYHYIRASHLSVSGIFYVQSTSMVILGRPTCQTCSLLHVQF